MEIQVKAMADDTKFYATISLENKETKELAVSSPGNHLRIHADRFTGQLAGHLTALQPLHIGNGDLVPPMTVGLPDDVPLVKAFFHHHHHILIPGSSLKGAVRSLVEAVTFSCVNQTGVREIKNDNHLKACSYNARRHQGELCLSCYLFGGMGFAGRVMFFDAPQESGGSMIHYIPAQHKPEPDDARRYYPHQLIDNRDPVLPLQVTPVGSVFAWRMSFQNLSLSELGLLLLALGQIPPSISLKVGGGKSSGLGAVSFELAEAYWLDISSLYNQYETASARQPIDANQCWQATKQEPWLRQRAVTRLQNDLSRQLFPGDKG